jgi:hypothetical protein
MAMLIGILVVAFPVSVFSDLWSQELKRSKQADLREKARKRAKAMLLSTRNATRRSNGKSQSLFAAEEGNGDDHNKNSGLTSSDDVGEGNNLRSNKTPPMRSQSAPSFPTSSSIRLGSSSSSSIRSASSLRSSPSLFRKGNPHAGSSSLRQGGREEEKSMAITSIQEMEDDEDEEENSVVEFRDMSKTVRDLNGETDGPLVVVERDDLVEIHQCLHAIRTNERRVQALLGKYKL